MATRSRNGGRTRDARADENDAAQAMRESVQKIWLAGLGALERARTDGPRVFETLVEQGRNMGARAVGMADDALKQMREASYSNATWQKLEQGVQDRLVKSLNRLGMAGGKEVEELTRQVRELNETVRAMMQAGAGTATRARSKARGEPRKTRAAKARASARARRTPRARSA